MKYARTCIAAVLGAGALVEFVFWGGTGIGATLLFLILLAAYYIACGFPAANLRHSLEHGALAILTAALALCYTLFANESLRIINFLVLFFLMGLLFLHGTVGRKFAWDNPRFQIELCLGFFARPFVRITQPWKEMKELRSNRKKAGSDTEGSAAKKKILFQILAAVLAAVPLLFILISLLASSDPVFRNVFAPFNEWLASLRISEVVGKIILFLFFLPFVASTIWSYRDLAVISDQAGVPVSVKPRLIPAPSAITVLAMVNAVYLLYAAVQFAYLFGALGGNLPDGLTPAQYARSGFFELAFISCINAAMLLVSIRLTRREGKPGMAIRCLATCLLALSTVQLVSAMTRMNLYVQTFGFTQLRYFVSAFMILIAVYFVFLLLREFISAFPLFRCMVFAGAAALVILNFTVPDARIAQYNIDHYQSGQLAELDVDYLYSLSADAKYILFQKEGELTTDNTLMKSNYQRLKSNPEYYDTDYRLYNWKMYNVSQEKLRQYLLDNG